MSEAKVIRPGQQRDSSLPEAELLEAADTLDAVSRAVETVAKHVAQSVVAIRIERPGPTSAPGYESRTRIGSVGSGVIISADGLIVTADHVITHAEQIVVTTPGDAEHLASVVGRDELHDLALVRIDARGLTPIELASATVSPGKFVLAVGRPPRIGFVVSRGIVSVVNRSTRSFSGVLVDGLIQTTAVVEPGVSGGAMADSHGRLIGVVTSATDSSRAISFAVPAGRVREAIREFFAVEATVDSPLGAPGTGG